MTEKSRNPYSSPQEEALVGEKSTPTGEKKTPAPFTRIAVFLFVLVVGGGAYWFFGDQLTFKNLAAQEARLQAKYEQSAGLVYIGAFCLYVVVSGLSIPGGAVALSLSYGSFFGWLRAVALVSFASTAGATVAFLLSRYLFRDVVQRTFERQLKNINAKLEEEGGFYLFTLRLIPLVPFFMLNLVMGLTRMKTWSYWWISQVGMLAGTMAYIYAGSTLQVSELAENGFQGLGWEVALAFAILGIFPLAARKLVSLLAPQAIEP